MLRSASVAVPTVALPTPDAWMEAEGMVSGMWSEADQLAEYREHTALITWARLTPPKCGLTW